MTFCISAGIEVVDPNRKEDAVKAMAKLVEQTATEPGCILFEVRQDLENANHFTLWEIWEKEEDLTKHFQYPHTKAYLAENWTQVRYVEKLQGL
ncbi:putative quinol monooxygenase [Terasakiella sp. A23]|uniref:putative quinol monooxygenase n=1 Tax=Terasakiella sp. FCG-A23 TaxID=3080561 RepID=UPI002954668C|nr:putative quinol monooxygenase [Terasakiella sp. A23]MDV7340138.1 putative quinol monooxygenase [Terasakiella sp. A23]